MKHHFLHYMDQVIHNRWRDVAFVDYGEKKQYTHGEVAQQVQVEFLRNLLHQKPHHVVLKKFYSCEKVVEANTLILQVQLVKQLL